MKRSTTRVIGTLTMALACAGALPAAAVPITVSNAGYWLETVGINTIGLASGGTAAGTTTALFVANTAPDIAGGTTAAAVQNGDSVGAVGATDGVLWARRVVNPSAAQLAPLTVNFTNGADTASFTGRSLVGLAAMPLVQNLHVDGSSDPFGPLITWSLPAGTGDYDVVQLVFYSDASNLEVGNRVTLSSSATSFDITSNAVPSSFNLVINVRLIDLADDSAPFTADNILRMSRTYVNYTSPVPEPAAASMLLAGLAALGWRARRASVPGGRGS